MPGHKFTKEEATRGGRHRNKSQENRELLRLATPHICQRCAHLAKLGEYKIDAHKFDYLHCEAVFLKWSIEEWKDRYEENCCCELCHRYRTWLELKAISDKEDAELMHYMEMFLKKGAR